MPDHMRLDMEVGMSLYACEKCNAIENTALGQYWMEEPGERICSECATGTWHGEFLKRDAKEAGYYTDGNFLYGPDEVDPVKKVWTYNPSYGKNLRLCQ